MSYLVFLALAAGLTLLLMILGLEHRASAPVLFAAIRTWVVELVPICLLFWALRKKARSVRGHLLPLLISGIALCTSRFLFSFQGSALAMLCSAILLVIAFDLGVATLGALVAFLATSRRSAPDEERETGRTHRGPRAARILLFSAGGVVVGLATVAIGIRLGGTPDAPPPLKSRAASSATLDILFIGNSLTYYNHLPRNLERLAALAEEPEEVEVRSCVAPGRSLPGHWDHGMALRRIRQGGWDYVVLQEGSFDAVLHTDRMHAAIRKFDHEIRQAGARTALHMAAKPQVCLMFPPPGNPTVARIGRFLGFRCRWLGKDPVYALWRGGCTRKETLLPLDVWLEAYASIASELDAVLVPAGLAWDSALKEDPTLRLYQEDGNHPSELGTYLSVCVFYASLTGRNPEALPGELTRFERDGSEGKTTHFGESEARPLQRIAWQSVQRRDEREGRRPGPSTAEGWFALAMVYESAGKEREALDAWQAYLERGGVATAIARRHLASCRDRLAAH